MQFNKNWQQSQKIITRPSPLPHRYAARGRISVGETRLDGDCFAKGGVPEIIRVNPIFHGNLLCARLGWFLHFVSPRFFSADVCQLILDQEEDINPAFIFQRNCLRGSRGPGEGGFSWARVFRRKQQGIGGDSPPGSVSGPSP